MDDTTMITVQPVALAAAPRVRAYAPVSMCARAFHGTNFGTCGFATTAPNPGSWKRSARHLGRRSIT